MLFVPILLVFLCVGSLSAVKPVVNLLPEKVVEIIPPVMKCLAEHGVDIEVLNKLRSGSGADSTDQSVPKFIHCGFSKVGVTKKNGRVDVDKVLAMFPKNDHTAAIKKVVEDCDKEGKDPVDTTFQFAKCFHKNSPVKVNF